jgi:hypothetical protein
LEVNAETGELEITWTIDDPAYVEHLLTQTEYFVRNQAMAYLRGRART